MKLSSLVIGALVVVIAYLVIDMRRGREQDRLKLASLEQEQTRSRKADMDSGKRIAINRRTPVPGSTPWPADRKSWRIGQLTVVRGIVDAVNEDGSLLVNCNQPAFGSSIAGVSVGSGVGASAAQVLLNIAKDEEKKTYGHTKIMEDGSPVDSEWSSWIKASGKVILRGHPQAKQLTPGEGMKVLAGQIGDDEYTLNYQVEPDPVVAKMQEDAKVNAAAKAQEEARWNVETKPSLTTETRPTASPPVETTTTPTPVTPAAPIATPRPMTAALPTATPHVAGLEAAALPGTPAARRIWKKNELRVVRGKVVAVDPQWVEIRCESMPPPKEVNRFEGADRNKANENFLQVGGFSEQQLFGRLMILSGGRVVEANWTPESRATNRAFLVGVPPNSYFQVGKGVKVIAAPLGRSRYALDFEMEAEAPGEWMIQTRPNPLATPRR